MPPLFSRLFAGLGLSLALAAAPAKADPPIWHVHGAHGVELTLFGSVHLLSDRTDWFTPALAAVLARADQLYFEIPEDAAAQGQAQAIAVAHGMLPANETLSGLLPPDQRTRLSAVLAQEGLPAATVEHLQPWLAEALISVGYFMKQGARADLGVEQQIDHAAPAAARRGAMESIEDQIEALAAPDRADQVASLEETLKDIKDDPQSFARLVSFWAKGDVRGLVTEELEPMRRESPSVYKRLVVDRNRRWLGEIETMLKGEQPAHIVIVVGVGHLVGSDSVPALLRRDGFKVEGP